MVQSTAGDAVSGTVRETCIELLRSTAVNEVSGMVRVLCMRADLFPGGDGRRVLR